tara:strand:- start:14245 stop:15087 length:843 start_codon:yes stop_codon:yes gene_type:complete
MSRLLDVHNFVADKLRWQLQVLLDASLTANARMVGSLIAHDLNVERGAAWRAQENMAIALGVHLSSIRRGVAELAKSGHLSIRRSRGRGRSQHYAALILDAAEAHDGIDRAIAARRAVASGTHPEKVSPANIDGAEKVSPANIDGAERVSPATKKGIAGERQYLEESLNPPSPPSRANRVRSAWGEPPKVVGQFPSKAVRGAVVGRLGEAGAVSWLDTQAWDADAKTIVTKLGLQAEKLRSDCGGELRRLGVTVVCDKVRHEALSRQPRPVIAGGQGLAA